VLLLVQALMTTWYIIERPLVYDEWYSWLYYSSRGFPTIFFDYSAPNNHLLYNMAARLVLLSGVVPEVAVRIPSLLAGLLTTWLFYRLCRPYFGEAVTLAMTALLMCNSCYAASAASARGYAFVNLFCVILLFSVASGEKQYNWRARAGMIAAQALGLFTIPSFLYVMVVPCTFLFIRFLARRRFRDAAWFCVDEAVSAALAVLAYSGILFSAQQQQLLNPGRWTYALTFGEGWTDQAFDYLNNMSDEIFGVDYALIFVAVVLMLSAGIGPIRQYGFLYLVCGGMLLLPPVILLIHQVFPFTRSLYFLAIPGLLLAGAVLRAIQVYAVTYFPHLAKSRIRLILTCVLPAIVVTWLFVSQQKYAGRFIWEGPVNELRHGALNGKMKDIDTIAYSGAELAWLPAQLLIFVNAAERGEPSAQMALLDSVRGQDIVVIEERTFHKFANQLQGHRLLMDTNGIRFFCSEEVLKRR
jgi:hypothetical protein